MFVVVMWVRQAPPTFRTVHVGDDTKNHQSLMKEPPRAGPPVTGPGHMTNEVVTSKVRYFQQRETASGAVENNQTAVHIVYRHLILPDHRKNTNFQGIEVTNEGIPNPMNLLVLKAARMRRAME